MPLKTHIDEQPALNLTPMIDVTFLIVIFFLVGTKFAETEKELPIQVPQVSAGGALTAAPDARVVSVDRDGTVYLDNQAVSLEELERQLVKGKNEYEDLRVLVRGDGQVNLQPVVTVIETVGKARISEISIAVDEQREGIQTQKR